MANASPTVPRVEDSPPLPRVSVPPSGTPTDLPTNRGLPDSHACQPASQPTPRPTTNPARPRARRRPQPVAPTAPAANTRSKKKAAEAQRQRDTDATRPPAQSTRGAAARRGDYSAPTASSKQRTSRIQLPSTPIKKTRRRGRALSAQDAKLGRSLANLERRLGRAFAVM